MGLEEFPMLCRELTAFHTSWDWTHELAWMAALMSRRKSARDQSMGELNLDVNSSLSSVPPSLPAPLESTRSGVALPAQWLGGVTGCGDTERKRWEECG